MLPRNANLLRLQAVVQQGRDPCVDRLQGVMSLNQCTRGCVALRRYCIFLVANCLRWTMGFGLKQSGPAETESLSHRRSYLQQFLSSVYAVFLCLPCIARLPCSSLATFLPQVFSEVTSCDSCPPSRPCLPCPARRRFPNTRPSNRAAGHSHSWQLVGVAPHNRSA